MEGSTIGWDTEDDARQGLMEASGQRDTSGTQTIFQTMEFILVLIFRSVTYVKRVIHV